MLHFVVVQSLSRVWLCNPMNCSMPGFLVLHFFLSLLKLMSIESVMPSNHLILVTPFSFCPQSVSEPWSFPMSQLLASGGQSLGASVSASVLPMNIQAWLWFDLLAVQGTLKSLLRHLNSKVSTLWHSVVFMIQLSHLYWKNHSCDHMDLRWQSDVSAFWYAV